MIGPEVRRAFAQWWERGFPTTAKARRCAPSVYPLWQNGCWYMRERMPGARVWRAEDDGSFEEVHNGLG